MDVTIRGDGHYAGVDVLRPPQRLATNINPAQSGWHHISHPEKWVVMPGEIGVTTLGLMSHDLPSDWSYHTNLPQCGWHHISHPEKWMVMPGELGVTTLGLMSHDLPSDWSYPINPP